jgi:hypothetical protein
MLMAAWVPWVMPSVDQWVIQALSRWSMLQMQLSALLWMELWTKAAHQQLRQILLVILVPVIQVLECPKILVQNLIHPQGWADHIA